MKPRPVIRLVLALAVTLAASRPLAAQDVPTEPNSGLKKVELHVGKADLDTEIAATPQEDARGLMFRRSLGDNDGMLFFLPGPETAEFWMKNTLIPLSIAFLDKNGVILEIHDMQPADPALPDPEVPRTQSDSDQVCFAIEANLHWFSLNGVKAGDKVTPPPGTLKP